VRALGYRTVSRWTSPNASLAADRASPGIHPQTRTGASSSPRYRRPSANVTKRPSAIRTIGRVFM